MITLHHLEVWEGINLDLEKAVFDVTKPGSLQICTAMTDHAGVKVIVTDLRFSFLVAAEEMGVSEATLQPKGSCKHGPVVHLNLVRPNGIGLMGSAVSVFKD